MIYAVGDIHGQDERLIRLIDQLPLEREDLLVFVGDYIDRGPGSSNVIELLVELDESRGNCVFLRGNHEQMMLDAHRAFIETPRRAGDVYALWAGNGGDLTLDSYPPGRPWYSRIPDYHWDFIESTIFEYWIGPFAFVHAGFLPQEAYWPHAEDPRLWVREEFLKSKDDFGARVIFGHTPQRTGKPLLEPNKIGIDTAAAYGGPLTAVRLDVENPECLVFYQA
jgi:serine/threonine protein phosphatase 1